jgi:hypothetical protein
MAPSSSARSVTSAPRSVSVETITTGIGRRRISLARKSMPSMRGISTSSVITSGLRLRIISRATSGSAAAPMHSMSGWRLMISASRPRTSAESSTTTTRVFCIMTQSSRMRVLRGCQNRSTEPPELATGAAFAGCGALLRLPARRCWSGQALDHGLAAGRQEAHLARVDVQHVLADHRDAFGAQVVQHEGGVALADVDGVHAADHRAAAKDLGFHRGARGAALDQSR